MTKSSKQKKQTDQPTIHIGGNVIGDNNVIGNNNNITFQEVLKTTYGLFTIPQPVTDFTGREVELAGLKVSFTNGAIITGLSGAGGIGKTELARKLAHDIAENYSDAQMNIDLLGTSEKPTSPEDAMRRLLEPFYVGQKLPDDETQLKGLYQQTLGKKKVLLLLDNAANAAQVRPLIPPAPSAVIITSRQHFSLTEFGLHEPLRLDVLSPEKAREFLRGASPKINVSPDEEVNELAKICGHLPLALRVAASLLNDRSDWTINTLINRLQDEHTRLKRLKREGDYDVEATLNLSYELLDDDLKKHFRALGIFTAPFPKISAKAVLGIEGDNDELDDVLGKLIRRSLLNYQKSQAIVQDLYFMHDLTRLYATQKLLEEIEYEGVLTLHAEHFLQWASEADDVYLEGNDNILWGLKHFRFVWDHLYSAYERLLSEKKDLLYSQTIDRWLSGFPARCIYVLDLHVPPQEKIFILQTALESARLLRDKQAEEGHLGNLGSAYMALGDAHKAIEFFEQGLVIAREIGNRHGEGADLGNLGNAYANLGDTLQAIEFYQKHLSIARETGDRRGEGAALGNLGTAYADFGDAHKAIEFFEQGLVIDREIGNHRGEGAGLGNLGSAYSALGDARKAIAYYEQDLSIAREIGNRHGEGSTLGNLGTAYAVLGDVHKAIELYKQHLSIAHEIGDRRGEGAALGNLGIAYADLGDVHKAIEFYEQYLLIAREIGNRHGEGNALGNLGTAYVDLGDMHKAIEFLEQQLIVVREIGARLGEGAALGNLGIAYAVLGDARKAIDFFEQYLLIAREIGDRRGEGNTLGNLGIAYKNLGDARKAIEFYEQQLIIVREIGDRRSEGNALGNLGVAYTVLGDARKAVEFYEKGLVIDREIGNRRGEGTDLGNLGSAYAALGDLGKAIEFHEQCLVIAQEIGNRHGEGVALGCLGSAYFKLSKFIKAAELYEQQMRIVRGIGDRYGEGNALWGMAICKKSGGEIDEARTLFLDALKIFQAIESPSAKKIQKLLDEL